MKKTVFIQILGLAVSLIIPTYPLISREYASPQSERWDLRMIKEAPIWKNLLKHYFYAEHQRYWPERKSCLEKIVREFPQSRWADDAALILACGKASFENNAAGAILELDKVTGQYPQGQTVVASWDGEDGCRFDEVWLTWQAGLVFLNPDGTTRAIKPFDKDGQIFQRGKEVLAYFAHLERCPIQTSVMAQLFKAKIQETRGDRQAATATLEKIASESEAYLAELHRADRSAASNADGFLIRNSLRRPEHEAYFSLISIFEQQNNTNKAREKAEKLVSLCSPDGWNWMINSRIGDVFSRLSLGRLAREQYELAQTGLEAFIKSVASRSKLVEGSEFPPDFWELRGMELKAKIDKLK